MAEAPPVDAPSDELTLSRRDRQVLAVWVGFIALCGIGAGVLYATGHDLSIGAAPLYGRWRPEGWLGVVGLVPAIAFAWWVVRSSRRWSSTLSFARLVLAVWAASALFAVLLAARVGAHGLTEPLDNQYDYLDVLPRIGDFGEFLRTFTERIADYSIHVQGHPPGFVSILVGLDRIGLGGPLWEAAFVITSGSSAAAAVLLVVREVASEATARAAAWFLVLVPAAIYLASTADAFYAALCAWGTLLIVLATARRGGWSMAAGLAGGLLLGFALLCSYGLVLAWLVPGVIVVARRRWVVLVPWALGAAAVFGAYRWAGFWWFDGLEATRIRYRVTIATRRPYWFFVFNNLAALALVLGPAVAVGVVRLRDRRLWLLVGAALGAVALADLSGLSKAEVERIWLPFMPWIIVACAALPAARRSWWLGLQAASAVALQAAISGTW